MGVVELGDILRQVAEAVTVEDDREYQQVTVRVKGFGVVERGVQLGQNIGTKRQFRVRAGQWLISKIDARNGGMGMVPPELAGAIVTQDFPVFEIDSQVVDPQFFVLCTSRRTFWDECLLVSEGSTNRVRLDIKQFLALEVDLPTLDEQRRIVEVVGAVDALRRRVAKESEAARALLEAARRDVWADLDEAGDGQRIADLAKTASGGTPSRQRPDYFGGDIPWVKTSEVAFCEIDSTDECITEAGLRNSSAKLFPAGTVLVAMYGRGTVGRSALLTRPMATNQACAAILPCDQLRPRYLFHWLWSHYSDLIDMAEGTTNLTNISKQIVDNLVVPVPDLNDQDRIIEQFDALLEAVEAAEAEVHALRGVRDALVEDLLTDAGLAPDALPV
jgi:type I restriction enzyme S subunit